MAARREGSCALSDWLWGVVFLYAVRVRVCDFKRDFPLMSPYLTKKVIHHAVFHAI